MNNVFTTILAGSLWLGAPVAAMFMDKTDKLDVAIALVLPPVADWLYLMMVGVFS